MALTGFVGQGTTGVSTTGVQQQTEDFYNRALLERAVSSNVHGRFGQERPLPMKMGTKTMRFSRYNSLNVNTTALTGGVTPVGKQLSTTHLTATVSPYGDFIEITDEVDMYSIDPTFTEASEILGEQMGDSIDQIHRDIIVGGTTVQFSGSATSRATVVAVVTTADLDIAIRQLGNQNAKQFTRILAAGPNIGTVPVRSSYWAITDFDVHFTLDNLSGWRDVSEYAKLGDVQENEQGAYKNLRFVGSTNAKNFPGAGAASTAVMNDGANADVHAMMIFGMNSHGLIPLRGSSSQNIRKPFGSGNDPLNQRATSGWKAVTTAIILNDDWMVRLETAASL